MRYLLTSRLDNPSRDAWIDRDGISALTDELDDPSQTVSYGMLATDNRLRLLHLMAEFRPAAQQPSNRGGQFAASPVEVKEGNDRSKAGIIATE